MRLLVTGGSGYLGSEVCRQARALGWDVTGTYLTRPSTRPLARPLPPSHHANMLTRLDVRDAAAVEALVADLRPEAVLHTAYVQEGPELWATTVAGATAVARAASRAGARLVHMSTDVVFDGRAARPYREEDAPCPVTEYGRAKAAAERAVAEAAPSALLVRTSLLYGGAEPGRHELLALAAAAGRAEATFYTDERRCPTAVGDLAAALLELVATDLAGPLHAAGSDAVSRYELARLLVAAAGRDPGRLRGGPAGGGRPLDCALDSSRARALLRTRLRGVREVLA